MAFVRRVEKIFQEASVPEQRKIGLALTCLRGSAADWASIKEASFTSYSIFREMFINRFWGVDRQRDLFLHLSYGKFESGSRAEYFLNLVNQASFLSEPIPEQKLIKMLAKHFPPDIQRGMMILGLNDFDSVDDYLHNIDESYSRDRDIDRAAGHSNPNAYRESRNDAPTNNWRGEDAARNDDRNLRYITKFNADNDLMSEASDIEENLESEKFETPAILLEVGGEPLPALLDSGSEVTAISEKLYNKLVDTLKFPVLPVTKVSISVATGNIKQRIKKQVLLPIWLSDIGRDNRVADTLSRYPEDRNCMVRPENNISGNANIQRPKAILSDNGTQFASLEWKAVLGRENIAVKHISVYFPEGNMTERYNREIGRLLRTYCHDKHTRWAYVLGFVEQCINNAVNESTGYTPNFLQFGIQTMSPIMRHIAFPEDNRQAPSRDVVLVLARERLLAKAEQRAAKLNAKVNPVIFKEGDKVLMRVHAQSSAEDRLIRKLFLLYEGPYIVQRQAGPNSYVLVDDQGSELPKQNVINLKAYKELPGEC
nr:unnamed protein product [Callosobruchus analis]